MFGAFRTIWVHLGPFGCLIKLGAKRGELVQKFVPRSLVRIFRNERTRSTPLGPKLVFSAIRTILVHLGPFRCLMKFGAKRDELVQKFVPQSRFMIFRNERTRSTPLDPKLYFDSVVFGCIWDRSVALRYSVENGTNCCNKCKSSCHKVALEFFARNPPYPLHVLGHFIVFGCTWDHFVTA